MPGHEFAPRRRADAFAVAKRGQDEEEDDADEEDGSKCCRLGLSWISSQVRLHLRMSL